MTFEEWLEKQATDPTLLDEAKAYGKGEVLRLLVLIQQSCYRHAWNAAIEAAAGKADAAVEAQGQGKSLDGTLVADYLACEIRAMKAGETEVRE